MIGRGASNVCPPLARTGDLERVSCLLELTGVLLVTFAGLVFTLWLVNSDPEGVRVAGVLIIVTGWLVLTLAAFTLFHLLSPSERAERIALAEYVSFQAAVDRDDLGVAWDAMCPGYQARTSREEFEAKEARLLATTIGQPTAEAQALDRVLIHPAVWSGGAHVLMVRSSGRWCLLSLADWSYD